MVEKNDAVNKPPFALNQVKAVIYKRVLIGLTYYDHEGIFIEQKQMHGKITSVDEQRGFEIKLEGSHRGETFMLPPDLRSFKEAKPGEYREHSTGEIVINPDFICTWEINKPLPCSKPENKTS